MIPFRRVVNVSKGVGAFAGFRGDISTFGRTSRLFFVHVRRELFYDQSFQATWQTSHTLLVVRYLFNAS